MVYKYVEDPIKEKEQEKPKLEKFDTITKLEGSLNAKVVEKQRQEETKRKKLKQQLKEEKAKSLLHLEANVEKLLMEEALVVLTQEFIDRLREVFS